MPAPYLAASTKIFTKPEPFAAKERVPGASDLASLGIITYIP